jgi:hypothetical protein
MDRLQHVSSIKKGFPKVPRTFGKLRNTQTDLYDCAAVSARRDGKLGFPIE